MALTNADNPAAEKPAAPATAAPKLEAAPTLGRASESGDAGVHFLLAQRQTHAANEDFAAVKAVDEQLAALGFAV
ncbi:MAG: hypothetical protein V4515_14890 [Chloroflexota bacterium]